MPSTKRKVRVGKTWRISKSRIKCFIITSAFLLLLIYILAAADVKISAGAPKVSAKITSEERYIFVTVHDIKLYIRSYYNRTIPIKLIFQTPDGVIEEIIGYNNPNETILLKNIIRFSLPKEFNFSSIFINRDMLLYAEHPGYTPAKPYIVHCIQQNYFNVIYYAPGYLFSNITVAFTYKDVRLKVINNLSIPVSVNIVVYFLNGSRVDINTYFLSKGIKDIMLSGDINNLVINRVKYFYIFNLENLDDNAIFTFRDNIVPFTVGTVIFAFVYCLIRKRCRVFKG